MSLFPLVSVLFCFHVEVAVHYTLLPLYVNVSINVFHALVDTVIMIQ